MLRRQLHQAVTARLRRHPVGLGTRQQALEVEVAGGQLGLVVSAVTLARLQLDVGHQGHA
ncbi:hypothetical protein D3C86_2243600 [compost metagenome]